MRSSEQSGLSGPYRLKEYHREPASKSDFPAATTERPVVIHEGHTTKACASLTRQNPLMRVEPVHGITRLRLAGRSEASAGQAGRCGFRSNRRQGRQPSKGFENHYRNCGREARHVSSARGQREPRTLRVSGQLPRIGQGWRARVVRAVRQNPRRVPSLHARRTWLNVCPRPCA